MAKSRRSKRNPSLTADPYLPQAFRATIPRDDPPQIKAAWRRYVTDGNEADFNALVEHYLPVAFVTACRAKRRRPDFYTDEISELVSDGIFGLMKAIRHCKSPHGALFVRMCRDAYYAIRVATEERHCGGRTRMRGLDLARSIRRELFADMGRPATDEEVHEKLRYEISNPMIYVGEQDAHLHAGFSQLGGARLRTVHDLSAPKSPDPLEKMERKELLKLALKEATGDDRIILQMIVDGANQVEIAKRLKVQLKSITPRINGACWRARCNRDLAEYMGVEFARGVPRSAPSLWPAMSQVPPARRIAS